MKIYVAGKFEKKDLILNIYKTLSEMGHSVSYDWTTHKNIKPYIENKNMAEKYAMNEVNGIIDSDIFIYLSDDKGHTLHMEFGAALMAAKINGNPIIYAVGEFNSKSPWFFNNLIKRRDTVEGVLKEIKEL